MLNGFRRFAHAVGQPLPKGNRNSRAFVLVVTLMLIAGRIAVATASQPQSIANGQSAWSMSLKDVAMAVIGVAVAYVVARVDLNVWLNWSPILVYGTLPILFYVYLKGHSVSGGQRWFSVGGFVVQPSEAFKFATVLFVPWLVVRYHNELGRPRQLAVRMFPVVAGAVLILIEPDLGTASVVGVLAVAMLWMANLNKRILRRIGVLAVLGAIGDMVWHPYQIGRLTAFLRPHWSLQGKNYQKLLSLRGLGAGGWAGLGLGHSKMKWGWLPNAHTDFIFTIIGEELGLIGTLVVLGLFVAWIIITARIVANCKNEAYRLVGTGIMVWIAFEALINILSVMGWWAVVGIPLPFFSYGGTSLIVDLAAMGLLYNIANSSDRALEVSIENHYVPTLQELRESRRVVASPRPREF